MKKIIREEKTTQSIPIMEMFNDLKTISMHTIRRAIHCFDDSAFYYKEHFMYQLESQPPKVIKKIAELPVSHKKTQEVFLY